MSGGYGVLQGGVPEVNNRQRSPMGTRGERALPLATVPLCPWHT